MSQKNTKAVIMNQNETKGVISQEWNEKETTDHRAPTKAVRTSKFMSGSFHFETLGRIFTLKVKIKVNLSQSLCLTGSELVNFFGLNLVTR